MTAKAHQESQTGAGRGNIAEQAADWLSRRDRGFQPGEQEEFSAWLLADTRHAAAAKELEATWRFLQKPRFTGQSEEVLQEIEARVKRRTHRRRVVWFSATGLAAAAAVLVIVFFLPRSRDASMRVIAGNVQLKPDRQTLPDGSVVELKAGAETAINFTPSARNVSLLRGTGLFTVRKDASRPFVVTAGGVSVRAVGTEFCVRFDPGEIDVLVTEGRVAVERPVAGTDAMPAAGAAPPLLVTAGHHASVSLQARAAAPDIGPISRQAAQAALAWRTRRVEFTDVPLKEIVRLFNQGNTVQLEVEPDAADVRISGIYWLDDPEGVSRLIEAGAGLKAIHRGPRSILLRRP